MALSKIIFSFSFYLRCQYLQQARTTPALPVHQMGGVFVSDTCQACHRQGGLGFWGLSLPNGRCLAGRQAAAKTWVFQEDSAESRGCSSAAFLRHSAAALLCSSCAARPAAAPSRAGRAGCSVGSHAASHLQKGFARSPAWAAEVPQRLGWWLAAGTLRTGHMDQGSLEEAELSCVKGGDLKMA